MKINFIDVGGGGNLPFLWEKKYRYIKNILIIDPFYVSNYYKKRNINTYIYKTAVFDKEEYLPLYLYKNKYCSSLFKPNPSVVQKYIKYRMELKNKKYEKEIKKHTIKAIKRVKCIRLDTIIDKLNINFDFLKVDAEGADFNIIKSLGKYLNEQIIGIQIELYFKKIFKLMSTYKEVNNFLLNHDFYQIKSLSEENEYVNDFLYLREDKQKDKQIELIKKVYKK